MILAISGSLRRASVNSAALRAAASEAARAGIRVAISDGVRGLPPFDPDVEAEPPEAVVRFRHSCAAASGVLLAVPEYTFGVPGWFKNALDWAVGSGSLYRKPVTVLKVSPPGRGDHVRTALELALRAHGADTVHRSVAVFRRDLDASGEIRDPRIAGELGSVVLELARRAAATPAAALSPGSAAPQQPPAQHSAAPGDSAGR
jgi:NAD(P)H-dependent FMN reductase